MRLAKFRAEVIVWAWRAYRFCSGQYAAGKHRPAPFTIGSVKTEDGAFVRTILDVAPMTPLKTGISVVTGLVDEARPDKGEKDLRFKPEEAGA